MSGYSCRCRYTPRAISTCLSTLTFRRSASALTRCHNGSGMRTTLALGVMPKTLAPTTDRGEVA